jgi:hypothetical protein
MDKIRKDDFINSYWMAPGGTVLWTLERGDEFFVQAIIGMDKWIMFHRPKDEVSVPSIEATLTLLGFQEFPIYDYFENAEKSGSAKMLVEQFDIYNKVVKDKLEIAKKQAKEAEKNQGKPVDGPRIVVP